jgi:ABC-2 type transport system ATP-binding protein
VLLNLSFEIPEGAVFGYIGPNGSGKTTTIKIMTGLIRDFQGDVVIEGRSIRTGDSKICSTIGYLPQQTSLQDWRTVDQALSTFGRLSGLADGEVNKRIKEVLEQLGISDYRRRKVGKLSGGTLQKVGMAQAMLHRPKLLVLDEPVAGLDPESRVLFKNLFRQLAREGTTVFFSSHLLSDIEDIATTIGILGKGRMRYVGSIDALREKVNKDRELRLETVEALDDLSWLESFTGIHRVERTTGNLFIIHVDPQAEMDDVVDGIIRTVLAKNMHIRGIQPLRPSLEDLYMSYTEDGDLA